MIAHHHFGSSICSQKMRLVPAEEGIEFESREIDRIAGGQQDSASVRLHPAAPVVPFASGIEPLTKRGS